MKRLTFKQMRFCQWFILTLANGTQSARNAGYLSYPNQQAYRLYRTPSVHIFLTWLLKINDMTKYVPFLDNKILSKRLNEYGYNVNPDLVTYAMKTQPTVSIKSVKKNSRGLMRTLLSMN